MAKVKIIGAGSIGNHLAYSCRRKGWEVILCDIDPEALRRTSEEIYPARYGSWDDSIQLTSPSRVENEFCDIVIVGTPPDTHLPIAHQVLETAPPKIVLIEKPLCTPSLAGAADLLTLADAAGSFVCVGYNHTLTRNTRVAEDLLAKKVIGEPLSISAGFREYWGGIFAAHPWISGPHKTYLGFSDRGGGASGEHSHAINIWQHFARHIGAGRIVEVSATLDIVADGKVDYDRLCLLHVVTENGLVGDIIQDVITEPAQKGLRVQGSDGYVEWHANYDQNNDAVMSWDGSGEKEIELIPKTRPDDFEGEIDCLEEILANGTSYDICPIAATRGLDTMLVIAAAHISHKHRRTVSINYEMGYNLEALSFAS